MSDKLELNKIELTEAQIRAVKLAKEKGKEFYVLTTANDPTEEWRENNPFSSLEGIPIKDLAIALFVPSSYRRKRSTEELLSELHTQIKEDSVSENDETRIKGESKLEVFYNLLEILDTPVTRNFKKNLDEVPF